jgi:acyl-CoA reductase-like NAD-dependent aldehyde dehydrogenase
MNDEVVPELAWQMGRPVRYGGEFGGVDRAHRLHGRDRREALAPIIVERQAGLQALSEARAAGVVMVIAPWNYPFMTAINTIMPPR